MIEKEIVPRMKVRGIFV